MKTNEAGWDRAARIILGIGILSLTVVGPQSLWGLLGLIPLATGVVGFCPVYRLSGITTRRIPSHEI